METLCKRCLLLFVFQALLHISHNNDSACGLPRTFNKILGGTLTDIDEFPWLARLEYMGINNRSAGFACVGSLIERNVVLTAAHCINFMKSKNLTLFSVRLGEYNTTSDVDCVNNMGFLDCAEAPVDITIANYSIHHEYYGGYSDIALLFLKTKVNYTEFVRSICLPAASFKIKPGHLGIVSGWGQTQEGKNSTIKLKVSLPIVKFSSCYQKYFEERIYLNKLRHFCAGGISGKDSCTGDSGAPLMTTRKSDGGWTVIGITSIGKGCGLREWPGIYTKVSNYVQWIKNEIEKNENLTLSH